MPNKEGQPREWGSSIRRILGAHFGRTSPTEDARIIEETRSAIGNLVTGEGSFVINRHPNYRYGLDGKPVTGSADGWINKWDDGNGNPVYTLNVHDPKAIVELGVKIADQRTAFDQLTEFERARVETEFGVSSGRAMSAHPYRELLESRVLERKYELFTQIMEQRRSRKKK